MSDDGRHLAVMDDFCRGEASLDHRVLEFFTDGRPTRSFSLGQLVPDLRYVWYSVSHWGWFAERLPGWPSGSFELFDGDARLILTTLDLKVHEFDVASGREVAVHCSPLVPEGTLALSGRIRFVTPAITGVTPRRFEVTPSCDICGIAVPDAPVTFAVPPGFETTWFLGWLVDEGLLPNTEHWGTVFVRDGRLVGVLDYMGTLCD